MGRVQGAVASQYWAPHPGLASRHTVSPLNSRARGVTTCSMCDTVIACHRVIGMMLLFRSFRGMCVWDLKHLPLHRSLCDTMWDVTQCNCVSVTPCNCVTPGAAPLIVWHCVTVWHGFHGGRVCVWHCVTVWHYVSVTPCNCVTRLPWAGCVWHLKHLALHRSLCDTMWVWHCVTVWHGSRGRRVCVCDTCSTWRCTAHCVTLCECDTVKLCDTAPMGGGCVCVTPVAPGAAPLTHCVTLCHAL